VTSVSKTFQESGLVSMAPTCIGNHIQWVKWSLDG